MVIYSGYTENIYNKTETKYERVSISTDRNYPGIRFLVYYLNYVRQHQSLDGLVKDGRFTAAISRGKQRDCGRQT